MSLFFLHPRSVRAYPGLIDDVTVITKLFGAGFSGSMLQDIPEGSTVVPRYRAVSFGEELAHDVENLGSHLINSYQQHRQIANMFSWVHLLGDITAPVYQIDDIPYLPEGEWFIKGATNSKKNQWFQACYAPTTRDVMTVVNYNLQDSLIGSQEIAIRPFQHFRQLSTDILGRPVFHERRVFVYNGEILSWGDYWSSQPDVLGTPAYDETQFQQTVDTAIQRTQHIAPFYVLDVAEYPDGSWAVVELNDGSMAGLSENNPATVWGELGHRIQE